MTTSSSKTAKMADGLDRVVVQVGKYYGNNRVLGQSKKLSGGGMSTAISLPLTHHDVLAGGVYGGGIVNDFFQYMLVYPIVSPAMNHPGRGDEVEDRKRGVHHIHIGART